MGRGPGWPGGPEPATPARRGDGAPALRPLPYSLGSLLPMDERPVRWDGRRICHGPLQTVPSPVQPDEIGRCRAAHYLGCLAKLEPMPDDEREQFPVRLRQCRQNGKNRDSFRDLLDHIRCGKLSLGDPNAKLSADRLL